MEPKFLIPFLPLAISLYYLVKYLRKSNYIKTMDEAFNDYYGSGAYEANRKDKVYFKERTLSWFILAVIVILLVLFM